MKPSSFYPKTTPPPPFQRPKIEISAAGREWQWVYPEDIRKHDIIADFGLVQEEIGFDGDPYVYVIINGPNGHKYFNADVKIFAFTRKPT